MAVAFVVLLYKKLRQYLIKRYEAQALRDKQLKTALDAVSKYPEYRAQSIKIQKELQSAIDELKKSQDANTAKLQLMEKEQNQRECNKLRERLIQSYRFYTDKRRNPAQTWNCMEAEAFREIFKDYEKLGGNGYVHSVVLPAMNLLQVVEVGDLSLKADEKKGASE